MVLTEMADFSMKGKKPHSGNVPLKDLPIEHAKENVEGKYFHVKFDDPPKDWVSSDKIII